MTVRGPMRSRFFANKTATPDVMAATDAYRAARSSWKTEKTAPRSSATARDAAAASISPAPRSSRYSGSSECIDRVVQPCQRQRIHPPLEQLAGDLDRGRVPPARLRHRIYPGELGVAFDQAPEPHAAGLGVPMFDAAARLGDFIGAHAGIAHQNELVVGAVGAHDFHGAHVLVVAPPIVPPQRLVGKVVKIVVLEVLEFAARSRKQFLAGLHVIVHRPADVEQQQHLHYIVPLRLHPDVEPSARARSGIDGVRERELIGGPAAGKAAQAAHRHLDVARPQLDFVVQVRELAPIPDLHRASIAPTVLTYPHAFRVEPVGTEGRGPRRSYPLAAALMPLVLLFETLLERLHQRLPAAQRLDLGLLGVGEFAHRELGQPILRQLPLQQREHIPRALEMRGEYLVVPVVVALILHQTGARQGVEALGARVAQSRLEGFEQGQKFGDGYRYAGAAQQEKESNEHSGGAGTAIARTDAHPARS